MPHYSYEKEFAAGGNKETQEELEMPCMWGILTDITLTFRQGTDRTCKVHIDDGLHQIFPTNPDGIYAFDGYTLNIPDEYELLPATRKIYLRGWNEGNYPHTVAISFAIKMPDRLTPIEQALFQLISIIERMLGLGSPSKMIKRKGK